MKSNISFSCILLVIFTATISSAATTIDMEGLSPAASHSTEIGAIHSFGSFNLIIPYGHFFDSTNPEVGAFRPDNGTDWLMNDWVPPFTPGISAVRADGGRFSGISFDATEWDPSFSPGTTITITGHLFGGGTTVQQFSTDSLLLNFQTFALNSSFGSIVRLDIVDSGRNPPPMHEEGALAYDNIVLELIPEPSSICMVFVAITVIAAANRSSAR